MEKIELRKVRDFGAVFNDGIAFLKLNFKSFFGIILVLAGPFIVMTGMMNGYLQSLQSKLVTGALLPQDIFRSAGGMLSSNFIGTMVIFLLIYMLTSLVTTSCVCLYFKAYDSASPEQLPIEKNSVSPNLASTCWRLFYNLLLLSLILVIGGGVLAGILVALFFIPVLNVLVGVAVVVGMLIILPVVVYVTQIANYIIVRDELLVTDAIRKAIRYLKGNFWWTWLLMFCLFLGLATISGIFTLPLTILNMMKTFTRLSDPNETGGDSSIWYIIFGAISMVAQMLVVVPLTLNFCIFNYHSQEEMKEGTGLMGKIDEIEIK